MTSYFQTKVSVERPSEDGAMKKHKDTYLVKAESIADVERIVMRETGGDTISATEIKVSEIIYNNGLPIGDEQYFKARVMMSVYDDTTEQEKKKSVSVLIGTYNMFDAIKVLRDEFVKSVSDFEVLSIAKTPFKDIFTYEK